MAESVNGGVGLPVFDGTISVYNEGPILQPTFPNKSKDVFLPGSIGTPVFDGTISVRNDGLSQQDPNDNRSLNVELGGVGTPIFPGVGKLTPDVAYDPNSNRSLTVELLGTGTPEFGNDVTFITGNILNVG